MENSMEGVKYHWKIQGMGDKTMGKSRGGAM